MTANYWVGIPIGTTFYMEVEADDEEQAVDLAADNLPSLCAQCTGWGREWGRDEWEPDWDNVTIDRRDDGEASA